jgi:ElaB/YqjD/DUF883 family membrane-anchored ribosome-binding protein
MQFIIVTLLVLTAVVAFFMLVVPVLRGVFWFIGHIFTFIARTIGDALRILGGVLTTVIFVPLVLLNIVIGRWSAARHFGTAIQDEVTGIAHATYRLVLGNPARLLGVQVFVIGLEQRVPEAIARAPGRDKPMRRSGSFDGYNIVGSIAAGGSGAKLYVAEPDEIKQAAFARRGLEVDQVVIKSFSVKEGSSLPQIVRESRALEAAKKIGLVLEHELDEQRFFYVMPYVPGEDLGIVGRRLHEQAGTEGLAAGQVLETLEYTADLLETLEQYHRNGLWHKDVKPDNIIVHDGRAHLVDLGLVTPLRSAMTLTTHGTEYFRDPELVRMALKGVKVHEVNGVKFDIYAAGAVLYSTVENSFPAHGGLSHITKRCPEVVRWVIRRSMTEYDRRYSTANQMLSDLRAIIAAPDLFAMKPAQLPSMRAGEVVEPALAEPEDVAAVHAASPLTPDVPFAEPVSTVTPEPAPVAAQAQVPPAGNRANPRLRVANWWTGRYTPGGRPKARMPMQPNAGVDAVGFAPESRRSPRVPRDQRAPAHEQLRNARARANKARSRMNEHRHNRRCRSRRGGHYSKNPNKGVGVAVVGGIFILLAAVALRSNKDEPMAYTSATNGAQAAIATSANSNGSRIVINGEEFTRAEALEMVTRLQQELSVIADEVYGVLPKNVRTSMEKISEDVRSKAPRTSSSSSSSAARFAPATWLVLDDLGESASPTLRSKFTRVISTLDDKGWEMIDTPQSDEQVDLIASLRATIGTVQLGDPEAKRRINAWLRDHNGDISGVLWFPAATDSSKLDYRFYTRESSSDLRQAARVVQRLAR